MITKTILKRKTCLTIGINFFKQIIYDANLLQLFSEVSVLTSNKEMFRVFFSNSLLDASIGTHTFIMLTSANWFRVNIKVMTIST